LAKQFCRDANYIVKEDGKIDAHGTLYNSLEHLGVTLYKGGFIVKNSGNYGRFKFIEKWPNSKYGHPYPYIKKYD